MLMFKRTDWTNQERPRFGGLAGMVAACLLCLASVAVVAQTAFDFEDPLDDVRQQVERGPEQWAPETVTPSAEPATPETAARETVDRARTGAQNLSERLGLPKNGLLGLAIGALLAVATLLGWSMYRRLKAEDEVEDETVYATTLSPQRRRMLDSGAQARRKEQAEADEAADEDDIYEDEDRALADTSYFQRSNETRQEAAEDAADGPDARDPGTWKRPNLDRLKESIRADWKAEKGEGTASQAARDEAEAFAELFGEDDPEPVQPRPARPEERSPVLDMLDSYEMPKDDATLADIRDESAKQTARSVTPDLERKLKAALPSRAEALRRVKALRESVKAS